MKTKLETTFYGSKENNIIGLMFMSILLTLFLFTSIIIDIYLSIIVFLFIIIFIIFFIYRRKQIKSFLEHLDNKIITLLEKELNNPLIECHNHYTLTETYIIKTNYPYAILEYKDLILMYKKILFKNREGLNEYLVLVTKEEKYEFLISTTVLTINYNPVDFSDIIKTKNNSILIGNNKENKELLNKKYNIKI